MPGIKSFKTKWLIISLLIISAIVVAFFFRSPRALPRDEAEKLAAVRLDNYAKEVNLPTEKFVRIRVEYFEQAHVWQIVYKTKQQPIQTLSILVDNFRNVELHKNIESSSNEPGSP
jgi:hypothetical protein